MKDPTHPTDLCTCHPGALQQHPEALVKPCQHGGAPPAWRPACLLPEGVRATRSAAHQVIHVSAATKQNDYQHCNAAYCVTVAHASVWDQAGTILFLAILLPIRRFSPGSCQ